MSSTAVPGTSTIAAVKIFSALYDRVLSWSRHPHADRYLGVVSFTESSFFPIPPDVLLAPMTLARPMRWVYLAALTTVTSVLGGLFGYLIGHWAIDAVLPWLQKVGYMGHFETAQQWFKDYGFWAIFAAGAASMALAPFILGSVIGRGARFFLVAALVRFGGAPIEAQIRRYIDTIGWTVLAALLVLLIIWQL
jgi:membrane protein YqaA with SNARE-associated domain